MEPNHPKAIIADSKATWQNPCSWNRIFIWIIAEICLRYRETQPPKQKQVSFMSYLRKIEQILI